METHIKNESVKTALPESIPVVPAIDVTVFPHMIVPLLVLDERIIHGVNQALDGQKMVLILSAQTDKDNESAEIETDSLHATGTIASIMRVINIPDGGIKILIQGICRAQVSKLSTQEGVLTAHISPLEFDTTETEETIAITKNIKEVSEQLSMTSQSFSPDFHAILTKMQNPEKIAEFILSHLDLDQDVAQKMLESNSINELLELIYHELQKEISVAKVQERIRNKTRESINKSQNEYYLREQLKAIKQELGEDTDDIDQMRADLAAQDMPEKIRTDVEKQINKLEKISPESMEATVTRNHIEWLLGMPWNVTTEDNLDINHAQQVLDDDHHGLKDIKDRILDFISIKNLKPDSPSPILCFNGPPGTGKTSLGQSIAKALGRNFQRISLGGVKDESEIRGHRKTYVGALPGRFIQALKKAGTTNPIILIDELDKIGADFRGDPSAAMLEVLDPQQNKEFYDNYLGVPFDLSQVMFIATSNDISSISGPLRDRMEIINLSGYTLEEKLEIAKQHLMTRALEDTGMADKNVEISDDILADIIKHYTHESGVRHLTQVLKKLCSKVARNYVQTNELVTVTHDNLEEYLGPRQHVDVDQHHDNLVGITNGLAWTSLGGEMLKIEAVLMPGTGKLILTGQLGDVMKESAQAALSYARAHASELNIDQKRFTEYDLHIHLPAGGIPKDGPSAGITLLSSILSALTDRPIDATYAMTGELNLRGDVMPIGGVKEKILAAKRNNIKHVFLPAQNAAEFEQIKDTVEDIEVIFVKHANEVIHKILLPDVKRKK